MDKDGKQGQTKVHSICLENCSPQCMNHIESMVVYFRMSCNTKQKLC